jgi:DNA sulfur modification protein DndC
MEKGSPMLNSLDIMDHKDILSEIREQYLADTIPWVIGFSGGKDSTTILQMVFNALADIPKERLSKEVHVLFNDTLVENPAVTRYVNKQLKKIEIAGKEKLFAHNPELFNVVTVVPKLKE